MDVDLVVVFRDLVRLETELWNRVEASVQRAHGVPLAWVEVLQVVDATRDCRVLDISRTLSITVGGASKVVDRVEAAGLCRRYPSPTDGRSNVIRLTGRGAIWLRAADATFEAALVALLGPAAPEVDFARFSDGLRRLRQSMQTPEPVTAGAA